MIYIYIYDAFDSIYPISITRRLQQWPLCFRKDQTPMIRIPDRILLGGSHVPIGFGSLLRILLPVYIVVHLGEEGCYCRREPALSTDLEPAQVAAPVGGAQDGIRVLFELFIRDGFYGGNLVMLVRSACMFECGQLTGSSSALIPRNGILMASKASTLCESR